MSEPKEIKLPAKYYWGVKVSKELCSEGEIFLYADMTDIKDGNLTFYCEKDGKAMPCMSFSKENWLAFYSASLFDGNPTYVEHWKGKKGCED